MNVLVTRRALLGATVAVGTVALPAIAEAAFPAMPHADPDAYLLALIGRHADVETALVVAEEEADRRLFMALAAHPARPETLRWRADDFPQTSYAIGASDAAGDGDGRWYGSRGVGWLRRLSPPQCWTLGCEARRTEILTVFDGWRTECAEVDRQNGVVAAEEAKRATTVELWAAVHDIQGAVPHTIEGLRAKAAWLADYLAVSPLDESSMCEAFARQVAGFGEAAS